MRIILAAVLLSIPAAAASAQSSVQVSATVVAAGPAEPTFQGSLNSRGVTPIAASVAASVARSSILSSYRTDYGAGPALPTAGQTDAGPLEVVQTSNGSHFRKATMPASGSLRTDAASGSKSGVGANAPAGANAHGAKEREVTVTFTVAANS